MNKFCFAVVVALPSYSVRSLMTPSPHVKVPVYGDQLTRIRLAGAKDLRGGCHAARDRTDHVYSVKCADWHCKRSFLKVVYAFELS